MTKDNSNGQSSPRPPEDSKEDLKRWQREAEETRRNRALTSDNTPSFVKDAWEREDASQGRRNIPVGHGATELAAPDKVLQQQFDEIERKIDEGSEALEYESFRKYFTRRVDTLSAEQRELLKLFRKLHIINDVSDEQLKWLYCDFTEYFEKMGGNSPLGQDKWRRILEHIYSYGSLIGQKLVKEALIGGGGWLTGADISNSLYKDKNDSSLYLGVLDGDGSQLQYSGDGSLFTIAPPGSGKTRCNVFPNLLQYKGGAFVLDIKGECWENTSKWRSENVGKVFRFAPTDPDNSARYNPLLLLDNNKEVVWEECRDFAEFLITPDAHGKLSPWDDEGRYLLTAIFTWIVFSHPENQRSMSLALDVLSDVIWDEFILDMIAPDSLREMKQSAIYFDKMKKEAIKQYQGVLQSARRPLAIWQGARMRKVSTTCDWRPEDLRKAPYPTIYLCVSTAEVETYAPLLRVIIGQTVKALTKTMPKHGDMPVQIFLDEFPRLGRLDEAAKALDVGRGHGLRLWMFAQNMGQIREAYGQRADGMVGACAVQTFIHPPIIDGTARMVAELLGHQSGIFEGRRRPLAEPQDLAGEKFNDLQLIIGKGTKPAKISRLTIDNMPHLKSRMGMVDLSK